MLDKYVKNSEVKHFDQEKGIVIVELTIDMKGLVQGVLDSFKISLGMIEQMVRSEKEQSK